MPSRWEIAEQAFQYGAAPSAAVAFRILGNANRFIQAGRDFWGAIQYVRDEVQRERALGNPQQDVEVSLALDPEYGRPVKKQKIMSGPSSGSSGPSNMPYVQCRYSKSALGRKRKLSTMKRLKDLLRDKENHVISRWQSLTSPVPTSGTLLQHKLSLLTYTVGNPVTTNNFNMPVYAFNLSANSHYTNAGDASGVDFGRSVPMYRLYKNALAKGTERQWQWAYVYGTRNVASGENISKAEWQMEHIDKAYTVDSVFNHYRHDWSQIRLMLQGRNKAPVRVHLYICTFPLDGVGPKRVTCFDEGGFKTVDEDPVEQDLVAQSDYFWERFMEPKVIHPFASTKKTGLDMKHFNVLHHEVISLGSEVNYTLDPNPLQVCKSIFYRNGTTYDLISPIQTEQALMPIGNDPNEITGIKDDQRPGYSNVQSVRVNEPLPERKRDRWLVLVAENYKTDTQVLGVSTESVDWCPSFDICVRNKYTYDDRVGQT